MIRYSVQPIDQIFVKGYRFLSITKNLAENFGKNISKILSGKCIYFLIILNNLLQMQLKLIQKNVIQKAAAATSDLIVNRIANRFTKVSRSSSQTNSEKVTNEHDNDDDELLYGMVER